MKAGVTVLINIDSSLTGGQQIDEIKFRAFKVMDDIKSIPNFKYDAIAYTTGTNTITLNVTLSNQEIDWYSQQIKKIDHVLYVLNFIDPVYELREAKRIHDYFKVLAYSSTLLEYYGKELILEHFEKIDKKLSHEKIQVLSLNAIAINLYSNGIIDENLFNNINEVRKKRNNFIHIKDENKTISYEEIQKIENLSSNSIDAVSKLIEIYKNFSNKTPTSFEK